MNSYKLKVLANPTNSYARKMSDLMSKLDLGINCIMIEYEWDIKTKTKWTKKTVAKFKKTLEKAGWIIDDIKLISTH